MPPFLCVVSAFYHISLKRKENKKKKIATLFCNNGRKKSLLKARKCRYISFVRYQITSKCLHNATRGTKMIWRKLSRKLKAQKAAAVPWTSRERICNIILRGECDLSLLLFSLLFLTLFSSLFPRPLYSSPFSISSVTNAFCFETPFTNNESTLSGAHRGRPPFTRKLETWVEQATGEFPLLLHCFFILVQDAPLFFVILTEPLSLS